VDLTSSGGLVDFLVAGGRRSARDRKIGADIVELEVVSI